MAGVLLLAAHLAIVAWFCLRPRDVPWVMPANLRLFAGIRADLALGWPTAAWRIGKDLAVLAPLGVLLPMAGGKVVVSRLMSLLRTVTAGALVSLGIELLQTGIPGQVTDIDSLLLNTVGVALLHLAVVPAARARMRRRGAAPVAGDEGHTGATQQPGHPGPRTAPGPGGSPGGSPGAGPGGDGEGTPAQGHTPTIPRVGMAP